MPSVIARIRALDNQEAQIRQHKNKYGPGITPVYDQDGQVLEIRFSELSEPDAREWLESHGYRGYVFEGGEEDHPPGDRESKRYLAVALAPSAEIKEVKGGGLLVPGVRLLAPGTWTDSTQKTPCRYTPDVLQRYAANWTDKSYWSRHGGGTPRDITDRIGDIQNLRYNDGVTADLFLHGATSKSKDTISLVKAAAAGRIPWPYSSVEMRTRDKWVVGEKVYEAQEIIFDGAAMVNQGACRTCRIRNNEGVMGDSDDKELAADGCQIAISDVYPGKNWDALTTAQKDHLRGCFAFVNGDGWADCHLPYKDPKTGAVKLECVRNALARLNQVQGIGDKADAIRAKLQNLLKKQQEADMDTETEIQNLKKELADLKAAQNPPAPPKAEMPKELVEALAKVTDLTARIEKMEKQPGGTATVPPAGKELGTVETFAVWDKNAGTVKEA